MKRFEAELEGCSDEVRHGFFRANFADLMGPGLSDLDVAGAAAS
jgi:hypothetical protein